MLARTHGLLDRKDETAASYKSFLAEQRYSAYVIEGAIAAVRSGAAKTDQDRLKLGDDALEKFEAALNVDGKASDVQALELLALQFYKLDRLPLAAARFDEMQRLIETERCVELGFDGG